MQNRIEINYSRRFLKQISKLPSRIFNLAEKKEKIFRENPFDFRLNTHKLHGKEKEAWVFYVTESYRVKFIFLKERIVLFLEVGTYDIYK